MRLWHLVSTVGWCGMEHGLGTPLAIPPAKGAAGSAVSVAAGMHCLEHNWLIRANDMLQSQL